MKPYSERTPDTQYRDLLSMVRYSGEKTISTQEVDCYTIFGAPPMRFRLDNGFPIITERNMDPKSVHIPQWQQAIGEICAFINGAYTTHDLEEFGCLWWKLWATEKKCAKRELPSGDLGPGSYGVAFHSFPGPYGRRFNQFESLLREIRELPHLRTHFISPWIPYYIPRSGGQTQGVVVAPCHGWIHIRIINGKFSLHMYQRSGDMVLGVPNNMTQYAALTMMLAHVLGYEPYEYIHTVSDAHIYVDQEDAVRKMLSRDTRSFPTVVMDESITNLFDFRREHFVLSDYHPHPGIKSIPAAI